MEGVTIQESVIDDSIGIIAELNFEKKGKNILVTKSKSKKQKGKKKKQQQISIK